MSKDETYVGVFLPEDAGMPVALCRDVAHARAIQRALADPNGAVVAPARGFEVDDAIKAQFAPPAPAEAEPGSTADPQAFQRAVIRTELEREQVRADLTKEVKADMKDDAKAERPSERELREPKR